MPKQSVAPAVTRRGETAIVDCYLNSLGGTKIRGRRPTAAGVESRLSVIDGLLVGADPVTALHLHQERLDLNDKLRRLTESAGHGRVEDEFVAVAAPWGARHGIGWRAWRAVGVPAAVLTRAGVRRSG